MKITPKTRSNFAMYMRAFRELKGLTFNPFLDALSVDIRESDDGMTAIECFALLDNRGERLPCRERVILLQCLSGKKLLNFWIEQWAEGINDGLFSIDEIMRNRDWIPDWAWVALRGQLKDRDLRSGEFPWITAELAASRNLAEICLLGGRLPL